ncbi:hypothetical protein KC19_9G075000 [Ceratodon purpureus]|uniref:Uncharacterized protein n=1 Tax=Ceratodon purpureus TaxID=3225 RepID=A0A8T0GSL5_CERPU|nr:hypothetical protein KC19_9G075000 [Ceratodon purpureus]
MSSNARSKFVFQPVLISLHHWAAGTRKSNMKIRIFFCWPQILSIPKICRLNSSFWEANLLSINRRARSGALNLHERLGPFDIQLQALVRSNSQSHEHDVGLLPGPVWTQ